VRRDPVRHTLPGSRVVSLGALRAPGAFMWLANERTTEVWGLRPKLHPLINWVHNVPAVFGVVSNTALHGDTSSDSRKPRCLLVVELGRGQRAAGVREPDAPPAPPAPNPDHASFNSHLVSVQRRLSVRAFTQIFKGSNPVLTVSYSTT
jgi:hypothetical protein